MSFNPPLQGGDESFCIKFTIGFFERKNNSLILFPSLEG
jgi:hypothetical protein